MYITLPTSWIISNWIDIQSKICTRLLNDHLLQRVFEGAYAISNIRNAIVGKSDVCFTQKRTENMQCSISSESDTARAVTPLLRYAAFQAWPNCVKINLIITEGLVLHHANSWKQSAGVKWRKQARHTHCVFIYATLYAFIALWALSIRNYPPPLPTLHHVYKVIE